MIHTGDQAAPRANYATVYLRFGLGLGVGLIVPFLIYRRSIFDPTSTLFQCVTVGVLAAGTLALLRSDRPRAALALTTAFALMRLGFAQSAGWNVAVAGALQSGGVLVSALIFDLLARRGILFGKFLVLGPLLGGVFLAVTPLAVFHRSLGTDLFPTLMRHVFLGLLIGDTVGFGIEVADLLVLARSVRQARSVGS